MLSYSSTKNARALPISLEVTNKNYMLPGNIQTLIREFSRLPGIGPRQAARFAFHLLRSDEEISSLLYALNSARESSGLCENCFLPARKNDADSMTLCTICDNPRRNKNHICVVEKETDAVNFEKSGYFQGHYYVLGGFIDPLEENSTAHKRLAVLLEKAKGLP